MFALEVKGTFLECRMQSAAAPRAHSQPAPKVSAFGDLVEVDLHRAQSYAHSLSASIGLSVEAAAKVQSPPSEAEGSYMKRDISEGESAREKEDSLFPLNSTNNPFEDRTDIKWLPIADNREVVRNRMMSSCSTTCTGFDSEHEVRPRLTSGIGFDGENEVRSRLTSGALWDTESRRKTSWDNSSLRKTSRADSMDNFNDGMWSPKSPKRPDRRECKLPEQFEVVKEVEQLEESQALTYEVPVDQTTAEQEYTTVMLCELPCRVTQLVLAAEVEALGFGDDYDFLYVPARHDSGLGYGFVNFLTASQARAFSDIFQNYQFSNTQSKKLCTVKPARLQGFQANVDQFEVVKRRSRGKAKQNAARPVVKAKEYCVNSPVDE